MNLLVACLATSALGFSPLTQTRYLTRRVPRLALKPEAVRSRVVVAEGDTVAAAAPSRARATMPHVRCIVGGLAGALSCVPAAQAGLLEESIAALKHDVYIPPKSIQEKIAREHLAFRVRPIGRCVC